jgi:hypothetical protein
MNSILFGLAVALIGYLIVNRLKIERDRIREFNELIRPIRISLMFIKEHPYARLPNGWAITLRLIREKLPFWKRRGFDRACISYDKSHGPDNYESDDMGGFTYKNTSIISHSANDLLKYLKEK